LSVRAGGCGRDHAAAAAGTALLLVLGRLVRGFVACVGLVATVVFAVTGFVVPFVVLAAGGKVSDLQGGDAGWLAGKETLATNGRLHAELLAMVKG
jgi:hypothetical protein